MNISALRPTLHSAGIYLGCSQIEIRVEHLSQYPSTETLLKAIQQACQSHSVQFVYAAIDDFSLKKVWQKLLMQIHFPIYLKINQKHIKEALELLPHIKMLEIAFKLEEPLDLENLESLNQVSEIFWSCSVSKKTSIQAVQKLWAERTLSQKLPGLIFNPVEPVDLFGWLKTVQPYFKQVRVIPELSAYFPTKS